MGVRILPKASELHRMQVDDKMTVRQIAAMYRVSPQAVHENLRRCGFRSTRKVGRPRIPLGSTTELLAMNHKGLSANDIGKKLGVSSDVVRRRMVLSGFHVETHYGNMPRADSSNQWKGDRARYQAMHIRVRKKHGSPRLCSCCGCTDALGYDWANLTGHYEDLNDYVRLCKACHKRAHNYEERHGVSFLEALGQIRPQKVG